MEATHSGKAKLELRGDKDLTITREFDAPRELVWEAMTAPEHVRQWWGAKRGSMTECEVDLRPGGSWRYAMKATDGQEVAFHGEYREIEPPERLVTTEVYEMPGMAPEDLQGTLNTVTLTEGDGRTTVEVLIECPSAEVRDGIIASGMEDGMQESYDALEEVARSLA